MCSVPAWGRISVHMCFTGVCKSLEALREMSSDDFLRRAGT